MDFRAALEKKIKVKEEEISELIRKIDREQAFLQGLQEALRALPKSEGDQRQPTDLRIGTVTHRIYETIRDEGRPLPIREILHRLGKDPNDRKILRSVAGTIAAFVRKGEIFTRTGPNTFGLIELYTENAGEHETGNQKVLAMSE